MPGTYLLSPILRLPPREELGKGQKSDQYPFPALKISSTPELFNKTLNLSKPLFPAARTVLTDQVTICYLNDTFERLLLAKQTIFSYSKNCLLIKKGNHTILIF